MNIDKEILQNLVKNLKKITGKTQGELSKSIGYNEKYISTAMSGGDNLQPIIDQLQLFYKKELLNEEPLSTNDAIVIALCREVAELKELITGEDKDLVLKRLLDATYLLSKIE